ncbi:hypothetical protein DZF91_35420 [Actinomadura logoneensis]|uniref:DUF2269 family protein n=1 Tax=Actinomadura logoneensis TaxID=2293572 RepID=A0A372JAE9_9ACTN|nr:hypothetical protein [Actinomadura logoneensis]RFU36952.1 hypothetical protein DZF91_35420 [Actinomadura logoneensis]
MTVAALIIWLLTAFGGVTMLGLWIARGGVRAPAGTPPTRLPAPVVFGHGVLAVAGLVLWIIYMATDTTALAWISFVLLLVIAALGFVMVARWLPTRRILPTEPGPPERAIPVPVVVGHGLLAVVTVVLVLIASITS